MSSKNKQIPERPQFWTWSEDGNGKTYADPQELHTLEEWRGLESREFTEVIQGGTNHAASKAVKVWLEYLETLPEPRY